MRPVAPETPPVTVEVLLARARELIGFATHRARGVRLVQVAASLTFSSVLAIVPLLAVALSILTAFPFFGEMRASLEKDIPVGAILPDPYAKVIVRALSDFAAKAAGVGALGLAVLLASALSVILTVDRILNDIWQVHRRRSLLQRVLVYWAVLSVGPLLLGASLSLTSYLVGVSAGQLQGLGGGLRHLLPIASPVLAAAAYSIVYMLVPNRPVQWRHAVAGGVVTAITGELMSRGFAAYIVHGGVYSIYGAFAAVPVFLMWIYLSWLTFLFGAAIAATLPQLRATRFGDVHRVGERFVCAVAILRILLQRRSTGAVGAARTTELAALVRVDHEEADAILGRLRELGYVRRLEGPVGAGEWILVCDPKAKGLAEAYHAFAIDPDNSLLSAGDAGLARWLAPGLHGRWLHVGLSDLESRRDGTGLAAGG